MGSRDMRCNKGPFARLLWPHSPRRGFEAGPFCSSASYNACLHEIGCKIISCWKQLAYRVFTYTRIYRAPDCARHWRELSIERPWRYPHQPICRTRKNSKRYAGSINFGNGIRSRRNVIAWFAAHSSRGGSSKSLAEPAATARCDSVVQRRGATPFQWTGCCPRMRFSPKLKSSQRKSAKLQRQNRLP